MPECTKAEREYLDATFSRGWPRTFDKVMASARAVRAEWREGVVAKQEATASDPALDETRAMLEAARLTIADQYARIADLKAALAEERAKPKEGARRFSSKHHLLNRDEWVCNENRLAWSEAFVVGGFVGPDAERYAREHAAKLQAEHDSGGSR